MLSAIGGDGDVYAVIDVFGVVVVLEAEVAIFRKCIYGGHELVGGIVGIVPHQACRPHFFTAEGANGGRDAKQPISEMKPPLSVQSCFGYWAD